MAKDLTLDRVKQCVLNKLPVKPSQVTENAKLVDDLKADPVDVCEVWWQLELEFDLELPDSVPGNLHTVKDLVKFVKKKVAEA